MRAFGRDLIRGGHYGQRSCEPHLKAEHMAAPTNAAYVKRALANSEPSTHGPSRHFAATLQFSRSRSEADIQRAKLTESGFMSTGPRCGPLSVGFMTNRVVEGLSTVDLSRLAR